ncbi:Protein of unknown function [Cotesia congregata]|uniref:Uncharacterized protein n=1 Tax=Cotesia congregata TaxID=51543 RepID=A0A8J2H2Y7_COTCN|nr:Protein of unknown function [Cotesia congregata]
MDRERWPWIIMKEEMRGLLNGRATKWGKEVKKILEKMGCEEVVRMIYKEQEIEEIETKLDEGIMRIKEEAKKEDEEAIEKSSYCKLYKKIKIDKDKNYYWGKDEISGEDKETWARVRCGNIGRGGKKGFKDWRCRVCEGEEETLMHIMKCEEIYEKVGEEGKSFLNEWKNLENEEVEERLIEVLKGRIDGRACTVFRKIEEILREKTGLRNLGQEGHQNNDVQTRGKKKRKEK